MAKLHILGEFGGPGEARTAETLKNGLPDDWVVIASKQLVRAHTTRDVDFLVIGRHVVFVCEDKSWHGPITGRKSGWVLSGGQERRSPIDQAVQVAKAVAGHLSTAIPSMKSALRDAPATPTGMPKAVHERVILSATPVSVDVDDPRVARDVYILKDACDRLQLADAELGQYFSIDPWRAAVIDALLELPERPEIPATIGSYKVVELLQASGHARQYLARHDDGAVRILKVYPRESVVDDSVEAETERNVLLREYTACRGLRDSGRVPNVDPYFDWDVEAHWVVPMHPITDGVQLRDLDPAAADVLAIATDAFAALHELHAAGVVHRNLSPDTVWVRPGNRLMFSDLHLARLAEALTLPESALIDDGSPANAYQAPETVGDPHAGGQPADVYALASVLVEWATGTKPAGAPDGASLEPLEDLAPALASKAADRPTAKAVVERLTQPAKTTRADGIGPGAIIANRYRVVRNLGSGATATAWLVIDESLDEQWTLKVLRPGALDVAAVKTEYQALRSLQHNPSIVTVKDALLDEQPPKLIVEYVAGANLREAARGLRREPERLWDVLIAILEGLQAAHQRHLLHRDISPANIIIPDETSGAAAKLIDFGLAGTVGQETGVGTPRYRAPEIDAGNPWTAAADVFALAASTFEAATGRLPYVSDELGGYDKHRLTELNLDGEVGPLLQVLLRALAKDPEERFADAGAFLAAVLAAPRRLQPATPDGDERKNPTVDSLRALYRNSRIGNHDNRGLDSPFARETYVRTGLDDDLTPRIVGRDFALVVLSGNPGDGKTAYLEQLGKELQDKGARVEHADKAGWLLALGDHRFRAVFDASEAHGELSADDLLADALDPLGEYPADGPGYTAIIAINDGRLLHFFEGTADGVSFGGLWEELRSQVYERADAHGRVVLIDLKERSLVGRSGDDRPYLAGRVLAEFTAPERWETCEGCIARRDCPLLYNAKSLHPTVDDDPAARLLELLRVSHVRRHRRATVRDLRSALAWTITGDIGCEDVHALRRGGTSPLRLPDATYPDRIFSGDGKPDLLLDEWAVVDTARTSAPRLERILHRSRNSGWSQYGPDAVTQETGRAILPTMRRSGDVTEDKRRYFFEARPELDPHGVLPDAGQLLPYKHFDEIVRAMSDGPSDSFADRVRLGLSRILGVPGYQEGGVAVTAIDRSADDGAVVKVLPASEVLVEAAADRSTIIETAPDHLIISHRTGHPRLIAGLDQLELVLRAATGYLPINEEALAIVEELVGFADLLRRHSSDELLIVEPTGLSHKLRRDGSTVEYVTS